MSIQNNTKHFKTFIAILIFGLGFFNNVSAQTTVDCSGNPLWLPGSIYSSPLTKVVYNGVQYQNKWWTQGNQPDLFLDVTTNKTDGSKHWILLGTCTAGTTNSAVVPNYWSMNEQTTFLNTIPSVTKVNINTPLSSEPTLNTPFYSFNVTGRSNFIGDDNAVSIWSNTKSNTLVGGRRQYLSFHNAVYSNGYPYGIIGSNSFKLGASPETKVTDLILQPNVGAKVGIGTFTQSPEATLHVNGDMKVEQTLTLPSVSNLVFKDGSTFGGFWQKSSNNIYFNSGIVGIGTTTFPNLEYMLRVNGKILCKGLKVQATGWADYVFKPGYQLMKLDDVKAFIEANDHLPDVPSEASVKENEGFVVEEMNRILLQKIEELTLYTIQLHNRVKQLEANQK